MNKIKLLSIMLGTFIFLVAACKKSDYQETSRQVAVKPTAFFNTHRTGDPTEQALVNYLISQNEKKNFVDKTISRIGYPHWDKMFAKKPGRKIISGTTRVSGDSVLLYYVPFVIDSQNAVNASMVILVSPTDTNFSYITDWQYQNRYYSPDALDSSAERYALFFMFMDNRVFGTTDFSVTDTMLFATRAADKYSHTRGIHLLPSNTSNIMLVETCITYAVCTTPSQCQGHAGGCDYENPYFTDPPCCYIEELCFGEEEVIPP